MKDHTRRRYRDEPEEAAPQPKRKSPSSRRKRSNARARISLYNRTEICQHALLIIPIVLAGALTFHYSSGMLKSEFSREFEHVTDQVARESTYRLRNQHNFLETLSLSVTSSTLSQQWPLITIPDFKNLALNYRRISHSQVIAFSPLVSASNQTTWEEYSKGNGITPYIYRKEGSDRVRFYSNPYSLPFWQASPDEGAGSINNNLLYTSWVKSLVEASLESKDAMLSEPLHPEFLFAVFPNAKAQESKEKWSILVQPIRIAPKENTDPNADSEIGGFLFSMLPWSSFLRDILWNTDESVICVIRDNLNYAFSYQLKGSEALYLGEGDSFHDPKWHPDHVETTPFTIDTNGSSSNVSSRELQYGSSYTYTLEVYPTSEFYNYYVTEEPWIYTTIVVAIFVAVALWFLSCDCCKKYRENRIKDTEERTMDYSTTQTINHRASRPNRKSALPENNKQRLNQFLVDTSAPNKQNGEEKEEHTDFSGDNLDWDSKPVADFFPSATVMMADLTHFTAWSSIREPAQIFFLLETVYAAFDKLANRRKIFKVDTVGDCYVAVCGLPRPCQDHALVMCQYARSCMRKFLSLTHKLEEKLGPETTELGLRVGINSGAVVAGVLRSDQKQISQGRFQLFGETVNLASYMESTGEGGKVHLSKSTANLLTQCGKGHWLQRRRDPIFTKTGEMQTFWLLDESSLQPQSRLASRRPGTLSQDSASSIEDSSFGEIDGWEEQSEHLDLLRIATEHERDSAAEGKSKVNRLIGWNCEVMIPLLKMIVARREAEKNKKGVQELGVGVTKLEKEIGTTNNVLDEVEEVINLPEFDSRVQKKVKSDPGKVKLGAEVESQLREYVALMASLYRNNPFHNFEHASHVTQSTMKLLSRIVAPDDILDTVGKRKKKDIASSLHDCTYGITSDPLTQFAVVLSALIHDVDHRGIPNFLLIKEDPELVAVYHNKNVAEQNSVDIAWEALMDPRFEALRNCIYASEAELKRFRQLVVNSVMSTDIFDKELSALRKDRWTKAFKVPDSIATQEDINRKATIVIEHLIQASDVSHTMQHWHVYKKWNERLFQELYTAYRLGRSDKNPSEGWYQGEIGFFDNYVIPLAKKLKDCGVFGVSSDEYLNYATANRDEWKEKGERIVENLVDKYSVMMDVEGASR